MDCEFEEKQFEQHLNTQLLGGENLLYPPGQVLENVLGFDAALYTDDYAFWRHIQQPSFWPFRGGARRGIQLDPGWWEELNRNIDSGYFPPFKFNVFLQHKRPQYLTSPLAKEWKEWNTPFYRYRLKVHQQKALEELGIRIGNEGIVVYASPAFYQLSALWNAVANSTIINQTNFAEAARLSGHTVYTYVAAGSTGKAHSESEAIESYDFKERLSELRTTEPPAESNRRFLVELGDIVNTILSEHRTLGRLYDEIVSASSERIADLKLAIALMRVDAFCFLTKAVWRIGF